MRWAWVVLVLVGLVVGVAGASAGGQTPAERAIALIKQAEAPERLALSRVEGANFHGALAAAKSSEELLNKAGEVIGAGQKAGIVGSGVTPSQAFNAHTLVNV